MDHDDFAHEFGTLYRELYRLAVRRVDDARDVMSPETTALLLHLSQTGPLTLSELAQHLDRAPSTLSVKVSELESRGLLARQRDEQDSRKAQLWLSAEGRRAMLASFEVLDSDKLAAAAEAMDAARRAQLLEGLRALLSALTTTRRTP